MLTLCFQIKEPIGAVAYIPHLKSEEVGDFVNKNNISVVAFSDYDERVRFMTIAIQRYKHKISYAIAPESAGAEYGCERYPCIIPFNAHGKRSKANEAPRYPFHFVDWSRALLHEGIVPIYSPEALAQIFNGNGHFFLGVNKIDLPEKFPKGETLYTVRSELLSEFGINASTGYYIYRVNDRQLVRVTKNWQSYIQTPLVDLRTIDFDTAPLIVTYITDEYNQTENALAVSCLTSLAKDFPQFYFGPAYGQVKEGIRSMFNVYLLNTAPLFVVLNMTAQTRWGEINDVFNVDKMKEMLKGIADGTLPQKGISLSREGLDDEDLTFDIFNSSIEGHDGDVCVFMPSYNSPRIDEDFVHLEIVSELLKPLGVKIFAFDQTMNDWPEHVAPPRNYPALYMWPKGKKDEQPLVTDEEPDISYYIQWISENSGDHFKAPEYNVTAVYHDLDERLFKIQQEYEAELNATKNGAEKNHSEDL